MACALVYAVCVAVCCASAAAHAKHTVACRNACPPPPYCDRLDGAVDIKCVLKKAVDWCYVQDTKDILNDLQFIRWFNSAHDYILDQLLPSIQSWSSRPDGASPLRVRFTGCDLMEMDAVSNALASALYGFGRVGVTYKGVGYRRIYPEILDTMLDECSGDGVCAQYELERVLIYTLAQCRSAVIVVVNPHAYAPAFRAPIAALLSGTDSALSSAIMAGRAIVIVHDTRGCGTSADGAALAPTAAAVVAVDDLSTSVACSAAAGTGQQPCGAVVHVHFPLIDAERFTMAVLDTIRRIPCHWGYVHCVDATYDAVQYIVNTTHRLASLRGWAEIQQMADDEVARLQPFTDIMNIKFAVVNNRFAVTATRVT